VARVTSFCRLRCDEGVALVRGESVWLDRRGHSVPRGRDTLWCLVKVLEKVSAPAESSRSLRTYGHVSSVKLVCGLSLIDRGHGTTSSRRGHARRDRKHVIRNHLRGRPARRHLQRVLPVQWSGPGRADDRRMAMRHAGSVWLIVRGSEEVAGGR
jgi:uncharacterized membrane protein